MLKKTNLAILFIIIFAVALTGCNLFKKDKTDAETNIVPESAEAVQEEEENFTGSIQSLISRGKPVKCAYSGEDDNGSFSGTTYIADSKARQDAESVVDGKTYTVHTIIDDKIAYFWTTEDPQQGFKLDMNLNEEELAEYNEKRNETDEELNANLNTGDEEKKEWEKDFDFKCNNWQADSSVFNLPDDVEFVDPSEIIKQADILNEADLPASADDSEELDINELKKSLCATCDSSPEAEECRRGLGCE
ncbi:MAG: hypothetical protein Q8Q23_02420 [bacterium]|nr:hypothetical protein [bacterium]